MAATWVIVLSLWRSLPFSYSTLSGILRLSPRRSVLTLKVCCMFFFLQAGRELKWIYKDRFVRLLKTSHILAKQNPDYNKAVRQRHAAILGVCALVDSYPYTVEKWMPDLLTNVLAEHTYDPVNFMVCHSNWSSDATRSPYRQQFANAQATSRKHIKIRGTRTPNVSMRSSLLLCLLF